MIKNCFYIKITNYNKTKPRTTLILQKELATLKWGLEGDGSEKCRIPSLTFPVSTSLWIHLLPIHRNYTSNQIQDPGHSSSTMTVFLHSEHDLPFSVSIAMMSIYPVLSLPRLVARFVWVLLLITSVASPNAFSIFPLLIKLCVHLTLLDNSPYSIIRNEFFYLYPTILHGNFDYPAK